jgi:hypothetical protein
MSPRLRAGLDATERLRNDTCIPDRAGMAHNAGSRR